MATSIRNENRKNVRSGGPGKGKSRSSDGAMTKVARERPFAAAAAIGGVVAAGIFLWSRRDRIGAIASDIGGRNEDSGSEPNNSGRTQVEIAEEALTLKEIGEAA